MKTKQEVIQEAWGELYEFNKSNINEDGYHYGLWVNSVNGKVPLKDYITDGDGMYAPKSLAGIDTNNNWISINSESDLPKKTGNYWVIWLGSITIKYWYGKDNPYVDMDKQCRDWKKSASHYQPIIKVLPPIY